MRRRGGVPKRQKSLSKKDSKQSKKKKIIALLFPLSFHRTVGRSSLSSCLFAEKKNSLSLSLLFCRPPPHCVKANNNTKR
jgi:ribosomal protein L32